MSISDDPFLDALLTLPRLYGVSVSPDRRWAAWTWFGAGTPADVFAAPADGSSPPIQLSDNAERTVFASWTPDSRGIIVQQDRDGNERVRLFRVDLDRPGDLVPLTEPDPHYYIRGGRLHPNGRWLLYAANLDTITGEEIEPAWIYRHDLDTGERLVLARPRRAHYSSPHLNETGTHILYTRCDRHPAGEQVWLVDIEGRDDREIINAGDERKASATWFPDSRRVLVVAETATHRRVGVWSFDGAGVRWVLDDPARNVERAWVPRGSERAVVLEVRDARTRVSLLDVETGSETPLPDAPGTLIPVAPVDSREWVGYTYSSRQPADVIRLAIGDPSRVKSLARVSDRVLLRSDVLAPAEDFRWRSDDGLPVQGWLYRPNGPPRGTIVCVHGGPTGHSEDMIDDMVQWFTHCGFVVLAPNYRGSTGFGLAYQEAIKTDGWGGREQDDIRTGIEALFASGIAEPEKVGITGTSYGGYSSWCAITRWPRDIVAAAAPICGMTDLVVDYETTRPDLRPYSEEMLGGSPSSAPDRYGARSPVHFVSNITGRLLIVQGMQDPNVTPENVRAVRAALDAAGVPYETLTFDDEGHGIYRPRNLRVLYRRLAEFFATAFDTSPRSAPLAPSSADAH